MKYNQKNFTLSSNKQLISRKKLFDKFLQLSKSNKTIIERNMGLFVRSSLLARFLAINEIYEKIVNIPGVICDFGCWYGQTTAILENLRSIHEPNNIDRRIHSFDTFTGYAGIGNFDKVAKGIKNKSYKIDIHYYEKVLEEILDLHQLINFPNNKFLKHKIYKGDCRKTLKKFIKSDNYPISLAFFDLNSYNATLSTLKKISNFFIEGTVLVFYQFQREEINGERKALIKFLKKFNNSNVKISKYYNSISYIKL
jgi:hypothetical protein